jgi:4-hydroxy-4-methyl-2-oxoglutarate aldolase
MDNAQLKEIFPSLSTALIADACLRLKIPLRVAASGIRPLVPDARLAGRVLPARHRGSVDVFLEAMRKATPGDVLVIDNEGRTDEGCIGDLTALEARANGLAGLVVRGLHRDTSDLLRLAIPIFSYGSCPAGPRRLDPRGPSDLSSAQWDGFTVDHTDAVFADCDGVLFVPRNRLEDVLKIGKSMSTVEREQAKRVQAGLRLSQQLDLDGYLARRKSDPSYTFRKHLKERGGAIEE